MVNEPTTETYTDAVLTDYIKSYPLADSDGNLPGDSDWQATYDLAAAAADVWEEKAAKIAQDFDFSADGASYSRSQVYENYMKNASHYRARRKPRSIRVRSWPKEAGVESDDL